MHEVKLQAATGYEAQLAAQLYKHFLRWPTDQVNLGQSDLVLVHDQSSTVGLCMQDYKTPWKQLWFVPHAHTRTQVSQLFTGYTI